MMKAGGFGRVLAVALTLGAGSTAFAAEDGVWQVSKSSGEVWMTTSGVQQASLGRQDVLKPGDSIRTGRNGRVLLVRGDETILVAPNSAVGLPTEKKEGLSTTIVQQAGSILLEVEKRNVKHFEVETPYLAAVVKGTQFRVSVNAASTSVDVIRGQVEVTDFKSGQIAQVMPGQVATAFAQGKSGLSLSGSGTLSPIEQGKPRASSIERIMVPKTGLSAPRSAANGPSIRALGHATASLHPQRAGVTRISASLGEVRMNVHKVTHGLAHGPAAAMGLARSAENKATVWSSNDSVAMTGAGSGSNQGNSGNAASGAASAGATSGATGPIAAATAAGSINGNGNANGLGNGANGNGNAFGHTKTNNGNAFGHTKP
jgi:hypothetical protein